MMSSISTKDAEKLMKRCQIGVGGRNALDEAHNIMAACYGTIGALIQERDALLKGEFICKKCGLRKNSDFIHDHSF
jgi:hypothetical protein